MPLNDYLDVSPARMARLARRAHIPIERLQQIAVSGTDSAGELAQLANALGVSLVDLTRSPDSGSNPVNFRFRAAVRKASTSSTVAVRTINELAAKVQGISEVMAAAPSESRRSTWNVAGEVRESPFALASWFRESCFEGDQVSPVLQLAKVLGDCLNVVTVVLTRSDVDGVCAVVDGVPFIFVRSQFRPRMLFTLAHELGHLLAHATLSNDFASLEPLGTFRRRRSRVREEERFANAFASELLLPRAGVGVALQQIRSSQNTVDDALGDIEILLLAHVFGVSFEVAALRCEGLKLLPLGGASSLVQFVKAEFGSPERRAAEIGIPDRPPLEFPAVSANVLQSASHAVADGVLSIGRVIDRLGVDMSEILKQNQGGSIEPYH